MSAPTVIALDDWLIFARDAAGEIVFAVSECWPEWLDFPSAPEDMDDEDFKRATLEILKHKRPQWQNYAQWFLDGERDFARARGIAFDEADAAQEVKQALASIAELAEKQRAYVASTAGAAS